MPLRRLFGIPLLSITAALASGVPGKSRAEVYTGTCACDYDSAADSCHAQQTVSGGTIEELSRVCLGELGENARIVAGSVRIDPVQGVSDPELSPDRDK